MVTPTGTRVRRPGHPDFLSVRRLGVRSVIEPVVRSPSSPWWRRTGAARARLRPWSGCTARRAATRCSSTRSLRALPHRSSSFERRRTPVRSRSPTPPPPALLHARPLALQLAPRPAGRSDVDATAASSSTPASARRQPSARPVPRRAAPGPRPADAARRRLDQTRACGDADGAMDPAHPPLRFTYRSRLGRRPGDDRAPRRPDHARPRRGRPGPDRADPGDARRAVPHAARPHPPRARPLRVAALRRGRRRRGSPSSARCSATRPSTTRGARRPLRPDRRRHLARRPRVVLRLGPPVGGLRRVVGPGDARPRRRGDGRGMGRRRGPGRRVRSQAAGCRRPCWRASPPTSWPGRWACATCTRSRSRSAPAAGSRPPGTSFAGATTKNPTL